MHKEGEQHCGRAPANGQRAADAAPSAEGTAASMESLSVASSNGSRSGASANGARPPAGVVAPASPTRGGKTSGFGAAAGGAPAAARSPVASITAARTSSSSPLKQKVGSMLKR